MGEPRNLREMGERVEGLLEELRGLSDEATRARAEEAVRLVVELYGAGLERIVELLRDAEGGAAVLERIADDPFLASLLVLHGLHPVPVEERIQRALDSVRPYLGSHAGGVEFLGIDEVGVVHLRLQGSCHGCPSSTVTVRLAIERAIAEAAPEVEGVQVEGVAEPPRGPVLLQVEPLRRGADAPQTGWVRLDDLGTLLPGETRVAEVGGLRVLVASVEGSLYVYRDACPACGASLGGARLEGRLLACRCGEAFDVVVAGRASERGDLNLDPLPLLADEAGIRVAVPEEVSG
jgi:Fe-S cluster biogenesis protein NfuA/nitrite reductase/ring-hydroxylating ferredoxin subunit